MKERIPYDDAVDLLDADHKAVKKMFIDYAALNLEGGLADEKRQLAQRICQVLTVHAQIEEEIFYPRVAQALGDEDLVGAALADHKRTKAAIAKIEAMKANDPGQDAAMSELGILVDQHVLEEREQLFLKARRSTLDLRGMTPELIRRQKQLKGKPRAAMVKETA